MDIMIVEDDAIISSHIAKLLESFGHRIISTCSSGEEAVKSANEATPDLALMDLRLRGEMDGVETGKELNQKFGIPIIFLSAFPLPASAQFAESSSFAYLSKPVDEDKLRKSIQRFNIQSKAANSSNT